MVALTPDEPPHKIGTLLSRDTSDQGRSRLHYETSPSPEAALPRPMVVLLTKTPPPRQRRSSVPFRGGSLTFLTADVSPPHKVRPLSPRAQYSPATEATSAQRHMLYARGIFCCSFDQQVSLQVVAGVATVAVGPRTSRRPSFTDRFVVRCILDVRQWPPLSIQRRDRPATLIGHVQKTQR